MATRESQVRGPHDQLDRLAARSSQGDDTIARREVGVQASSGAASPTTIVETVFIRVQHHVVSISRTRGASDDEDLLRYARLAANRLEQFMERRAEARQAP